MRVIAKFQLKGIPVTSQQEASFALNDNLNADYRNLSMMVPRQALLDHWGPIRLGICNFKLVP